MSQNSITIKNEEQIARLKIACTLASNTLEMLNDEIKAGITTNQINKLCHEFILDNDAIPAPLNYKGFPKSICTSVNNVVCHGIPNDKPLRDNDIINVDITVIKEGMHGDTSKMFIIGEGSILSKRLIATTKESMYLGIDAVKPGATLGCIGYAIQSYAENAGFSVVRDFCGHGIGEYFHEEPQILHYGRKNHGVKLSEGMVFTIEPMLNSGKFPVKILSDGWTAVTRDRSLSAQWEHTCLVTKTGAEILTLRKNESRDNMI